MAVSKHDARWRLWTDARLATMAPGGLGYGAIEDGAIVAEGGTIRWVGRRIDLPGKDHLPGLGQAEVIRCDGRWITPGLIDCHTHLVYGGTRAAEFERRLQGATYEEIARAGGGIRSTVAATRAATDEALHASATRRLAALTAEGVTTVEIKSGYGLDVATECRQLRIARALGRDTVRVRTTFLGAHAIPPEYEGQAEAYLDLVSGPMLDAVRRDNLADAVDAFCETIAFSPAQIDRLFTAARAHGLPVKLHAEQLSNQHGAALAARHGALSADHLEYVDDAGIAAMHAAGTVAVLLPGAFYFIRETRLPPVMALRTAGVPIAVATDCNPGSSPLTSPLLAMNMAATLFRLTPEECLAGFTRHAAAALGLQRVTGILASGLAADLAIWDIEHPAELTYHMGLRPLARRVFAGRDA